MSIPLEAPNSGSLSHTYFSGKPPLVMLVERWLTSSVKARESARISRQYGMHGAFSSCCAELGVPLDLDIVLWESPELLKGSQAICRVYVECGMAVDSIQGNWDSSQNNLGYTKLFCIPAVTSVSL